MRIGLMIATLNDQRSVSNDLLGMMTALKDHAAESIIFTSTGEADCVQPVMHYRDAELLLDDPEDVLIYHHCGDDPAGFAILERLTCRILVRYHATPPASIMSRWSAELGRTCRLGQEMLIALTEMTVDGFLVESAADAGLLLDLGIDAKRVQILPRLHRCDELLGQPDDGSTATLFNNSTYNVLVVGKVDPSQRLDLLAESFSKAVKWGGLDIHLHHVGYHDPQLQRFTDEVVSILNRNGVLNRFTFYGHVGPRALATFYRRCDVFWTAGSHDGFCSPAVEAMAFGLPILTSHLAALPEVCGGSATYADTEQEFAVQLHEILADDLRRTVLGRKVRLHYANHYKPGALRRRFLAAMNVARHDAATRVPATSLDRSGYWFDLPDSGPLLDSLLPCCPDMTPYGLAGQDRRRDLIDWALRHGSECEALTAYVRSTDLRDYANDIEMPRAARHLSAVLRLIWTFNRSVRSRFDLKSPQSVAEFCRWYEGEGATRYALLTSTMGTLQPRGTTDRSVEPERV